MTETVATWARYVTLDHWQSALSINALLHGTIIKGTLRLRPLLMYAYPFSFFSGPVRSRWNPDPDAASECPDHDHDYHHHHHDKATHCLHDEKAKRR